MLCWPKQATVYMRQDYLSPIVVWISSVFATIRPHIANPSNLIHKHMPLWLLGGDTEYAKEMEHYYVTDSFVMNINI